MSPGMQIRVYEGDITEAPADVVCTSTNPRLSLMLGTGGAVRQRGGFAILRACEAIVEEARSRTGTIGLPPGSVHVTSAGSLRFRAAIHCVASTLHHLSSEDIVRACVKNALAAAGALGAESVVVPLFGTGHARLRVEQVATAMIEVLRSVETPVQQVLIAVDDPSRAAAVRELLARDF